MVTVLSLQVDKFLQHFIGSSYYPGISLKPALGGDHIHKLLGEIHIGHLQATRDQRTRIPLTGYAYMGITRIARYPVEAFPHIGQTGRVLKGCQRNPGQVSSFLIGKDARYDSIGTNTDTGQLARRIASNILSPDI